MTAQEYRNEGFRLINGEECEPDYDRARDLFLKAVEAGDAPSAAALGSIDFENEDYKSARKWFGKAIELFGKAGKPEEEKGYMGYAYHLLGMIQYFNYEEKEEPMESLDRQLGAISFMTAHSLGNTQCRELLGMCYHDGDSNPHGMPEYNNAVKVWQEGMEDGDQRCTLRLCIYQVEHDLADETTVARLEALANDPDDPCADACAVLYQYYSIEDDDDMAVKWMERGLEMGSELMQSILDDEREQEIGEDDYSAPDDEDDDYEQEFEAYDDETEAPAPMPSESADLCVIIVDTDGVFRIEHADASDWNSLPKLIDADRTDDLRCTKFRTVSATLGLKGTLLGLLDRDAFRKPDLEPNWHASQCYDGMTDLFGDMIICLEDGGYNPFSFNGEAEARRVIEALKQ